MRNLDKFRSGAATSALALACLASATVPARTQQNAQAAAHESRIPLSKGSLYVRDIGRGSPILVIHGGPDFDQSYLLPEFDALANTFHLIYYDQRGRGKSADQVDPHDVTLASDVEDIDRVREAFHLPTVTVLGHSWGAVLALEYALRYPTRVSRVILLNPAPASRADFTLLRATQTAALGPDFALQRDMIAGAAYRAGNPDTVAARYRIHFEHAFAKPAEYEKLMDRMHAAFVSQGASGILEARAVEDRLMADSWSSETFDLVSQASAIRVPTLVGASDRDFIPMAIAEHLVRSIPKAQLVVFKECGHFSYMECPNDVRRALDDFFAVRSGR